MKYLENTSLEVLSACLTNKVLTSGRILNGRVEAYSTKKAGDDKKQSRVLEQRLGNTSPANNTELSKSTKKLLIDLIQTLNASLNDYDFSELTAESFALMTVPDCVASINSHFAELTVENPTFLTDMWNNIDSCINLSQCEAFCLTENPFADNDTQAIWSFIYFFCNKELKRVCLFTCVATNRNRSGSVFGPLEDEDDDDYEGAGVIEAGADSEEDGSVDAESVE